MEVVDQAYHFANVGSVTVGVSAADTPQAFREGLDITEQERKQFEESYPHGD